MGKVIYPRKGEVHTAPVTIPAVFADATWEQIIEACETNTVPDTWEIGDQKAMTINGTDYLIDIIGKNHDEYSDGSGKAPLTFQMHDCYAEKNRMHSAATNVVGWTNCEMRITTLPSILALMPSEVQTGIKEVNKITGVGNNTSTLGTTADKLFLLSEVEVLGSTSTTPAGEGSRYAYYSAGNNAVKNIGTSAQWWWLRSPRIGDSSAQSYTQITTVASISSAGATQGRAISFAFCF